MAVRNNRSRWKWLAFSFALLWWVLLGLVYSLDERLTAQWHATEPYGPSDFITIGSDFSGNDDGQQVLHTGKSWKFATSKLPPLGLSFLWHRPELIRFRLRNNLADSLLGGTCWHIETVSSVIGGGMYLFEFRRQETQVALIQFFRDGKYGRDVGLLKPCNDELGNQAIAVVEGFLVINCHLVKQRSGLPECPVSFMFYNPSQRRYRYVAGSVIFDVMDKVWEGVWGEIFDPLRYRSTGLDRSLDPIIGNPNIGQPYSCDQYAAVDEEEFLHCKRAAPLCRNGFPVGRCKDSISGYHDDSSGTEDRLKMSKQEENYSQYFRVSF